MMVSENFSAALGVAMGCIGMILGYWLGYSSAHADVARECERLGGFYIGATVYKCTKVEK